MAGDGAITMSQQVLVFTLGDTRYCVSIDTINEIVKKGSLTALPNEAEHVCGVMDLRGETTTIIDPKYVLDIAGETQAERVVIFGGENERPIGWLIDAVHEVADVSEKAIEDVSDEETVRGVIQRDEELLIWLDPSPINSTTTRAEVTT